MNTTNYPATVRDVADMAEEMGMTVMQLLEVLARISTLNAAANAITSTQAAEA